MTMSKSESKSRHVVMLTATHDASLGEVVKVTPSAAEWLIANRHAREPRSGEVKAAASEG